MTEAAPSLVAYPTSRQLHMEIVPAPRWRDWINAMDERWANRCLPLLIANQAGWALLNPVGFEAVWDGRPSREGIRLEFDGDDPPHPIPVESHFGYGILTWSIPYLFRTPPGYNLLARGPANWPKDGVSPLEGIVETDWTFSTFTMNWKLTREGHPVRFEQGEPICVVLPQRRGELESFRPEVRSMDADPETAAGAAHWARQRDQLNIKKFLGEYSNDFADYRGAWEQHYFRGQTAVGESAPVHQTQLKLADFERPDDAVERES
jgi:hypothetical protein